ncbi:MAG: sugar transferase [Bacteroidales bacterium]|nr:sugar transferase [Bacteroidales bacterium]
MTEKEKGKLLYIGRNQETIDQLSAANNVDFILKENGLEAIHWINNNIVEYDKLDAVLCSLNVQGMNAFSLYSYMRLRNLLNRVPFIVVAQRFEFASRELARYHNVDDYYALPLDLEKLETRIRFLQKYKIKYSEGNVKQTLEDFRNQPYKTPFIKRAFDIVMTSLAIIALSPIFIITAIAIRLESKGKVFYSSRRVGANFQEFDFYKFRSMYPDADKRLKEVEHLNQYQKEIVGDECPRCKNLPEGTYCSAPLEQDDKTIICEYFYFKKKNAKAAFLKVENDPRITKVGKFIRNKSIDELPQLFNILKGDMSIVGNRPLPVGEATAITKSRWSRRFKAAAGLTGLWQVELRGHDGEMSEDERFELDNKYARLNSFWGDLILIFRTLKIFVQKGSV